MEFRASYRPWIYFILWASVSFLLSYSSLSLGIKLALGLFGIILPLLIALVAVHALDKPEHPLWEIETLNRPASWVFVLILLGALVLRFSGLTAWPVWPNTDEGLIGRFAMDLCRQWNWKFFLTFGQVPPGMDWLLSWVLAHSSEPLRALWALPAVLSSLTVILSYWAARAFFPKSLSFLFFVLWSFSFWPLFYGRYCHPGVLLPLWALLVLMVLGFFLKSKKPAQQFWLAFGLGIVTGIGSFTFTPWVVLAFWIFWVVAITAYFSSPEKRSGLWGFLSSLGIGLVPFIIAVFKEGFGHHLFAVSAIRGYRPLGEQLTAVFSYLTAPFWGLFEDQPAYAPFWGGMLNPILTAAFLVGMVESYRHRKDSKVFLVWCGGFLCFLPGLMSMNVEMYRVILFLPFLLLGAAIGLHRLLFEISPIRRSIYLTIILLLSLFLDLAHLAQPYFSPLFSKQGAFFGAPPSKPVHSYRAYQILKKQASLGPGLFFSDFGTLPNDQTLNYASFEFNALLNPRIPLPSARWAAVLINANYRPYMEKKFPGGQWILLDQDMGVPDGGLMLGVIPITRQNIGVLQNWVRVYPFFRDMDFEWLNLADFMKGTRLLEEFSKVKPLITGDRFLESCYWEKTGEILYRDRAYPLDLQAFQKALQEGFPTAHLYYKIGSIQLRKNQFDQARESFHKAEMAPLNLTQSVKALQMGDELEKQGVLPQP